MIAGAHDHHIKEELPTLHSAFRQYSKNQPFAQKEQLLRSVDSTWMPNITMVDLDWLDAGNYIDVGENPFRTGFLLQQNVAAPLADVKTQLQIMSFWLASIAEALRDLKDFIKIEICLGDVNAIMEHIRYGVVGHRQQSMPIPPTDIPGNAVAQDKSENYNSEQHAIASTTSSADTVSSVEHEDYHKQYDRIHLSNIPDYVGSTLTSFMYALPLLYPEKEAFVTSNCLKNPPRFNTIAHFNNEYTGLSSPTDLEKVFHVRMVPRDAGEDPLPLADYDRWYHHHKSSEFSNLMPRSAVETWLYRLFFKTCMPKERTLMDQTLILSPLNLTAFVRLCVHLQSIAYPAHWISGVLENLLSSNVTTKARPPRSEPLKIREVKNEMAPLKQTTAPFCAELSTLVSMWKCATAFGILAPDLPSLDQIRKYTLTLEKEDLGYVVPGHPTFVLVLLLKCKLPATQNIRPYLLSDETADNRIPVDRRMRSLHIISTWTYDRSTGIASFWLRKVVMDSVRRGSCGHSHCKDPWAVAVGRTENWMWQVTPRSADCIVDTGVTWSQELRNQS